MPHELRFRSRLRYDYQAKGIALPTVLRSGRNSVELLAKLDTGASDCLFEREYADALGLRVEEGIRKAYSTANSSFDAYGHEITLEVLGTETTATAYFFADRAIVRNVLGRRGWVDRVRIGLVDHDHMVYLAAYDD